MEQTGLGIAKIILYIVCCTGSFIILFLINGDNFIIKKWHIGLPPLTLVPLAFILGFVGNTISQANTILGKDIMSIGFSLLFIAMIFSAIIIVKLIVPLMFDKVLDFHRTYNSANLHRNPVRFFIIHRDKITYLFYYGGMFIASLAMFYGAIWGHKK
jgi:hypothetical protein